MCKKFKILTLQIHICKLFMFLGGQESGSEIEIGTGILGLGLQSPWQTGKNSANSNPYVLPTLLDAILNANLAVSKMFLLAMCEGWIKYMLLPLYFFYRQRLTEKSWTDKYDEFINVWFLHWFSWFGRLSPFHMTFQSLWLSTWLFSHCGYFLHDFSVMASLSTWFQSLWINSFCQENWMCATEAATWLSSIQDFPLPWLLCRHG